MSSAAPRSPTKSKPSPSPAPPSPALSSASTLSGAASLSPRRTRSPGPVPSPLSPPTSGKTRARDLLRKHYGLGVGPPAPLPGKPMDPMNVDSPAFDSKTYYEQLITTSSLNTLLKRENELMTEIRELDSERQSLVYNHHHELIAARETITAMKARAENLDADLDKLKDSFSEISRLGAELSVEYSTSDSG